MPILSIDIVGSATDYPKGLAQMIADAAGTVLESRPRGTWVKLNFVSVEHYAENGGVEVGIRPVFVSLVQFEVPPVDRLRDQVSKLSGAIAAATGVPSENVHIVVESSARTRVAFGGTLVE